MREDFQVETFDDKDARDARYEELRGREGRVKFSGVKELNPPPFPLCFASTWSVAYPRELSTLTRDRDRRFPTGPCPKKPRRARFWRRHPKLHAMQMLKQSFVVPHKTLDGRDVAKNA